MMKRGRQKVYIYGQQGDKRTDLICQKLMRDSQTYYHAPEHGELYVNGLEQILFTSKVYPTHQQLDNTGHIKTLILNDGANDYYVVLDVPMSPILDVDIFDSELPHDNLASVNMVTKVFGDGDINNGFIRYSDFRIVISDGDEYSITEAYKQNIKLRRQFDVLMHMLSFIITIIRVLNDHKQGDKGYSQYFKLTDYGDGYDFTHIPIRIKTPKIMSLSDVDMGYLYSTLSSIEKDCPSLVKDGKVLIRGDSDTWDKLNKETLSKMFDIPATVERVNELSTITILKEDLATYDQPNTTTMIGVEEYDNMILNVDYDTMETRITPSLIISDEPFYYSDGKYIFIVQNVSPSYARLNKVLMLDCALEICRIWAEEGYNVGSDVIPSDKWHRKSYYRLFCVNTHGNIYYRLSYNFEHGLPKTHNGYNIAMYMIDDTDYYMALLPLGVNN